MNGIVTTGTAGTTTNPFSLYDSGSTLKARLYYAFQTAGTHTLSNNTGKDLRIYYTIVGGGGAGGTNYSGDTTGAGGGGGCGGVSQNNLLFPNNSSISIVIGAGGSTGQTIGGSSSITISGSTTTVAGGDFGRSGGSSSGGVGGVSGISNSSGGAGATGSSNGQNGTFGGGGGGGFYTPYVTYSQGTGNSFTITFNDSSSFTIKGGNGGVIGSITPNSTANIGCGGNGIDMGYRVQGGSGFALIEIVTYSTILSRTASTLYNSVPNPLGGITYPVGAYLTNAGAGSFPVFHSIPSLNVASTPLNGDYFNFTAVTDNVMVMPNYLLETFTADSYAGTMNIIDNTSGSRDVPLFKSDISLNAIASCRLYHNNLQSDTNNITTTNTTSVTFYNPFNSIKFPQYRYYLWSAAGTYNAAFNYTNSNTTSTRSFTVYYVACAGGGGGGGSAYRGSGGGGGGQISQGSFSISSSSFNVNITVGAGGAGGTGVSNTLTPNNGSVGYSTTILKSGIAPITCSGGQGGIGGGTSSSSSGGAGGTGGAGGAGGQGGTSGFTSGKDGSAIGGGGGGTYIGTTVGAGDKPTITFIERSQYSLAGCGGSGGGVITTRQNGTDGIYGSGGTGGYGNTAASGTGGSGGRGGDGFVLLIVPYYVEVLDTFDASNVALSFRGLEYNNSEGTTFGTTAVSPSVYSNTTIGTYPLFQVQPSTAGFGTDYSYTASRTYSILPYSYLMLYSGNNLTGTFYSYDTTDAVGGNPYLYNNTIGYHYFSTATGLSCVIQSKYFVYYSSIFNQDSTKIYNQNKIDKYMNLPSSVTVDPGSGYTSITYNPFRSSTSSTGYTYYIFNNSGSGSIGIIVNQETTLNYICIGGGGGGGASEDTLNGSSTYSGGGGAGGTVLSGSITLSANTAYSFVVNVGGGGTGGIKSGATNQPGLSGGNSTILGEGINISATGGGGGGGGLNGARGTNANAGLAGYGGNWQTNGQDGLLYSFSDGTSSSYRFAGGGGGGSSSNTIYLGGINGGGNGGYSNPPVATSGSSANSFTYNGVSYNIGAGGGGGGITPYADADYYGANGGNGSPGIIIFYLSSSSITSTTTVEPNILRTYSQYSHLVLLLSGNRVAYDTSPLGENNTIIYKVGERYALDNTLGRYVFDFTQNVPTSTAVPANCTYYHNLPGSISAKYSLAFWIYPTDFSQISMPINMISSAINETNALQIKLAQTTGNLQFSINGLFDASATNTNLALNTWTHVAITLGSPSANSFILYVNGTSVSFTTSAATTGSSTFGYNYINIGGGNYLPVSTNEGRYQFKGYMADIQYHYNTLDASMVNALANIVFFDNRPPIAISDTGLVQHVNTNLLKYNHVSLSLFGSPSVYIPCDGFVSDLYFNAIYNYSSGYSTGLYYGNTNYGMEPSAFDFTRNSFSNVALTPVSTAMYTLKSFTSTGPISISLWIYPTDFPSNAEYSIPFGLFDNASRGNGFYIYMWVYLGNLAMGITTDGVGGFETFSSNSNTFVTLNTWNHVVVTNNNTNSSWLIYVNNTSSGSLGTLSSAMPSGYNSMVLGGGYVSSGRYGEGQFKGYIRDVSIYKSVLTASKVTLLYLGSVASNKTSVGYMPGAYLMNATNGMRPIFTSISDFTNTKYNMGSADDNYMIMPGYKITIYDTVSYGGNYYTFDNTNNTKIMYGKCSTLTYKLGSTAGTTVQLYNSSGTGISTVPKANAGKSCKLYYQGVEIADNSVTL